MQVPPSCVPPSETSDDRLVSKSKPKPKQRVRCIVCKTNIFAVRKNRCSSCNRFACDRCAQHDCSDMNFGKGQGTRVCDKCCIECAHRNCGSEMCKICVHYDSDDDPDCIDALGHHRLYAEMGL